MEKIIKDNINIEYVSNILKIICYLSDNDRYYTIEDKNKIDKLLIDLLKYLEKGE